ncbi:hypothetical protein Lal_00025419 [Lupinus albus]|uniref:Putative transcription factor C2H2 family n=1 Tax=Lupinus albus TaxID=3870 RepID=A0A6A4PUK3_LUPAL|nr:putative transcription factor C2H2 family [Lupinus albus]KAF1890087.1 hypothetical protein Lal_00025419 [Lupinus albus]
MVDISVEFSGTICSICYESLNPINEDLQSISICGHVFHELCLQQWFEYSKAKKHTCPVCKQGCKVDDACRLYFQSIGEGNEAVLSAQKPFDFQQDVGVLRKEVKLLEVKVSGLSSQLNRQGKELQEVTDELCACKKQAKIDIALKNQALNEKATLQFQLRMKSEELEKSSFEHFRLEERNMALAKELAALKLASDLDLDEEDVVRLATLGNGANSKDTIDTLKKSLVLRNKSYKELMVKCNLLGRGEVRYSKKLVKAKEKIAKLKAKVQELETAAEVKENEYLMSRKHKASKKAKSSKTLKNSINSNPNVLAASEYSSKEKIKQILTPQSGKDLTLNNNSNSVQSLNIENSDAAKNKAANFGNVSETTLSVDKEREVISIDDDSAFTKTLPEHPKLNCKEQDMDDVALRKPTLAKPEAAMQGKCNLAESSRIDIDIEIPNTWSGVMDDDVTLLYNVKQAEPMINIRKESPSTLSSSGDICFTGGLLGPDGTHRYLGKWCKRGQNSEPASAKGSGNGDLIAVGADGRGGRTKALRSSNQTFSDGKESSLSSKRLKFGSKTNSVQSKGCLQIEHFFGRATQ